MRKLFSCKLDHLLVAALGHHFLKVGDLFAHAFQLADRRHHRIKLREFLRQFAELVLIDRVAQLVLDRQPPLSDLLKLFCWDRAHIRCSRIGLGKM